MFYSGIPFPPVEDEEALFVNIRLLNELIRCHTKGCFTGETSVPSVADRPKLYENERDGLIDRCRNGFSALEIHYPKGILEFMAVFEMKNCGHARQLLAAGTLTGMGTSPSAQSRQWAAPPTVEASVTPDAAIPLPVKQLSADLYAPRGDRTKQRGCFEVGCKLVQLERVLLRNAELRQNRREMLNRVQEILNILITKAKIPVNPPQSPPLSQMQTTASTAHRSLTYCKGAAELNEWNKAHGQSGGSQLLDEISIRALEIAQFNAVESISQWLTEACTEASEYYDSAAKLLYSLGLELETLVSLLTSSDDAHLAHVPKVFDNIQALKAASLSPSSPARTVANEAFELLVPLLKWDLRETLKIPHFAVTAEMKPILLQSSIDALFRLAAWLGM